MMTTDRDKIAVAFKNLRKQGIAARMNFACCGTCGHYEMAEKHGSMGPYVFYHQQEAARFDGNQLPEDGIYLQWDGGRMGWEAAERIVATLNGAGLRVSLPKDESECIRVRS